MWVVLSLPTQINGNISASTAALPSDKCLCNSILVLSSSLAWWCVALWKKNKKTRKHVWLREHSDPLNRSEKEHFNVMMRPRLPTTTTPPHPLHCRPQRGWLETGSAALCISSINLALSLLQWRMLSEAQRGIGRMWMREHFTHCYWACVFRDLCSQRQGLYA